MTDPTHRSLLHALAVSLAALALAGCAAGVPNAKPPAAAPYYTPQDLSPPADPAMS